MSKRKYTHLVKLLPTIKKMQAEGMTHREIEAALGLEGERPVHHLLKQERRREARLAAGIPPKPKGRPRKGSESRDIVAEQAYEIQRLKMENKLLRDFLQFTERK